MGKLRSLAPEETVALEEKRKELSSLVFSSISEGKSKSQLKKVNAHIHNEWQKYLKDNQIITILGRVFTEKETLIEGTKI